MVPRQINPLLRLMQRFQHFVQETRASVLIEFAFLLPVLIILGLGSAEVTRYILLHQKVEKTSAIMADVVAQLEFVNTTALTQISQGVDLLMEPFDAGTNSRLYISSISRFEDEGDIINWQFAGGGSHGAASRIGSEGDVPSLPAGFTLEDKENVIAAEFIYRYQFFILPNFLPNDDIYKAVFFKPRKVPLEELGD